MDVRGLNHPSKHLEVKNMIRLHKIDLICLLETRVSFIKLIKLDHALFLIGIMRITMISILWEGFGFVGSILILK